MRVDRIATRWITPILLLASASTGFCAAEATRLKEKGIPIASVLEKVRADSGEVMWASELVANKLVVMLDTRDATKARGALDLLPGYQWVVGAQPDGSRFYVLGPDLGERELWARKAAAVGERSMELCNALGKRRLQQYINALKLSDSQLDALIGKDPNLVSELRRPGTRAAIECLSTMPPGAIDKAFSPDGLIARIPDLPPSIQEALIADAKEQHEWKIRYRTEHPDVEIYQDLPEWEALEMSLRERGTMRCNGFVFGVGVDTSPEGEEGRGFMRPPGYFAEHTWKELRLAQGMSEAQAEEAANNDRREYGQRYAEAEDAAREDRMRDHPPRFGNRIEPDVKIEQLVESVPGYELLLKLCDQAGMALACHFFESLDKTHGVTMIAPGSLLGPNLDAAADSVHWRRANVWAHKDRTILVTTADFAEQLESEIPAHLVAKYRDRAASQGGVLTLDDLAEMGAELTDKQMDLSSMPRDMKLIGCMNLFFEPTHFRLYASLSPEQRTQAWSSGVPYTRMNRKQRRIFDRLAAAQAREQDGVTATPDTFRIEMDPALKSGKDWKNLRVTYSFKDLPSVVECVGVKALDKSGVKVVEVKQSVTDAPRPIPGNPKALPVAAALADWSYVALRPESGTSETRAVVETKAGEETKRRLLSVGKMLEGATLTAIEPERLTFSFDGSTLTLPVSRAVSLEPYDIECVAHGEGWVDYLGMLMDY